MSHPTLLAGDHPHHGGGRVIHLPTGRPNARPFATTILLMVFASAGLQAVDISPARAADSCVPAGKPSQSIEGVTHAPITFVNQSDAHVLVYWLNYEGDRQLWFELDPGQSHYENTWLTHPWVVTDESDNCVGYVLADKRSGKIYVIGDCDQVGTAGSDMLVGTAGNDYLCGLGGNDVLLGGGGDDVLDGGAGKDWASYTSAPEGVTGRLGKSISGSGSGTDTLISVENFMGSDHNDAVDGDGAANTMRGEDGADVMRGGGGVDAMDGGNGSDDVAGGTGKDVVRGGADGDLLNGNGGIDTLYGDEGDDELHGGPEAGNTLVGGSGFDFCSFGPAPGDTRIECEAPGGGGGTGGG